MGMAFAPSRADTSLTLLRPTLTLAITPSKFIFWCLPMRILVAEDDAPLAEFLQQRLQQEQFSVQMVGDGSDALPPASEQAYAVLILALNQSPEGGMPPLRQIRASKP